MSLCSHLGLDTGCMDVRMLMCFCTVHSTAQVFPETGQFLVLFFCLLLQSQHSAQFPTNKFDDGEKTGAHASVKAQKCSQSQFQSMEMRTSALMDLAEYTLHGLKTESNRRWPLRGCFVLILIQKKSIHWHLLPIKSSSNVHYPSWPHKKLLIKFSIYSKIMVKWFLHSLGSGLSSFWGGGE